MTFLKQKHQGFKAILVCAVILLLSSCMNRQQPYCTVPFVCQKVWYEAIDIASIADAQVLVDALPESIYIVGLRSQTEDESLLPHGHGSGFSPKKHVELVDIVTPAITQIPHLQTIAPLPVEGPLETIEHQDQNSLDTYINDLSKAYEDLDSVTILSFRVYGPRGEINRFIKAYPNWKISAYGGDL